MPGNRSHAKPLSMGWPHEHIWTGSGSLGSPGFPHGALPFLCNSSPHGIEKQSAFLGDNMYQAEPDLCVTLDWLIEVSNLDVPICQRHCHCLLPYREDWRLSRALESVRANRPT